MISLKIEYNKSVYHLSHPESFNELDEHQFRAVVANAFLIETPLSSRIKDQIILMNILLKKSINKYYKNKWFKVVNSMVEEGILEEILKLQEFIFKQQTFNSWIISSLNIDSTTLYGPKNRFSYMKFGEFISADMLFMGYFDTKSDDILDKFIAVIYRQADVFKKGTDIREDFESATLDERTRLVSKLDDITKQSIVFNYSQIRTWLADKYKFVFNPPEDKNTKSIQFGKKQNGWMGIRRHLAGDVLNLDKVDNVYLHDVLTDLNEKISEQ